jgi:IS30 family transposase
VLTTLLAGLGSGLSLIVAIGSQNAFVLRQGIRREHVGPVALLCALADALLIGAGVLGIGTLVERTTLFTVLSKMQDASAESALTGFSRVLNRIEAQKRLSMTYDQGREMAEHKRLTEATGVKVYFADPHSPWQRGINENTNGLLRQYLPKGTDLSGYTQAQLDAIAWELNTRPRRSMGFRCSAELLTPDAFDFKQHHASLFALAH